MQSAIELLLFQMTEGSSKVVHITGVLLNGYQLLSLTSHPLPIALAQAFPTINFSVFDL